ncbi:hypothetical protein CALCODRAFT_533822 [Calocera cornea HHB12733]|uniref:Uncharacterized protein n=1 Tax=Calocera cornea HHB12733 TaxID=1353952 RepID=A0A165K612_9BASI|nr:hypothetical protein CALCODRAFT_533822 [Calocera cornea HHB12733]
MPSSAKPRPVHRCSVQPPITRAVMLVVAVTATAFGPRQRQILLPYSNAPAGPVKYTFSPVSTSWQIYACSSLSSAGAVRDSVIVIATAAVGGSGAALRFGWETDDTVGRMLSRRTVWMFTGGVGAAAVDATHSGVASPTAKPLVPPFGVLRINASTPCRTESSTSHRAVSSLVEIADSRDVCRGLAQLSTQMEQGGAHLARFTISPLEPDVVMRVTPEPSALRPAAHIQSLIRQHFGDFADRSIELLHCYQRLNDDHWANDPNTFREGVMKRADIVNPFINFYYTVSLVSSHPPRLRDEISKILIDYQTLFAQQVLLPLQSGEGVDLHKISVRYLRDFRWLAPQHHTREPHPEGFADEQGNLHLWAQVNGAEVQLSVPWVDTLRLLVGQVGVAVLAQLGHPSGLSGKREILRWLRANRALLSMATNMELGRWPASLQVRFLQDATFAAEAATLYNIPQEDTLIRASFTPSFGWWRIEQDPNFEKCKTFARGVLDNYYGHQLLDCTVLAPIWLRQPEVLSVELYLLYTTESMTSYLLQCLMAHLEPSAVMMHRIHDILDELQDLLQRNSLKIPIPIPYNLLPLNDFPLDLFLVCNSTQEVGRKARDALDVDQWFLALKTVITNPGRFLSKRPREWIRCLCAAIGAFYVLYNDVDYDLVPTHLHETVQMALHTAWKLVPQRLPELRYILPYPPVIPRRIREQYRDVYGSTSADSHQALTQHLTKAIDSVIARGENFIAAETSSTRRNVADDSLEDFTSPSRPAEALQRVENIGEFHSTTPAAPPAESIPRSKVDGYPLPNDNTQALPIPSGGHGNDGLIAQDADDRHFLPTSHDHDDPPDPEASAANNPPGPDDLGWNVPAQLQGWGENVPRRPEESGWNASLNLEYSGSTDPPPAASYTSHRLHQGSVTTHSSGPVPPSPPQNPTTSPIRQPLAVLSTDHSTRLSGARPDGPIASSHTASCQGSQALGPRSQGSDASGLDRDLAQSSPTESVVHPPRKKARLAEKMQPDRKARHGKCDTAIVTTKRVAAAPARRGRRTTRLDVRQDPQRAVLSWYNEGNSFDFPIWISREVVRLKRQSLFYKNSMGEVVVREFDPVLVLPSQISAELIRKWGWVVTAYPGECSMTYSHGHYRCQDCQAVDYGQDPHHCKQLKKTKKIRLPPPDDQYTGFLVRRQPAEGDPDDSQEESVNGPTWHQIAEICIDTPPSLCFVCSARGRPCYKCLENFKDIPRQTFMKPLDQWVEGQRPNADVIWERLCIIQQWFQWIQSRPQTKSEKQQSNKREASLAAA